MKHADSQPRPGTIISHFVDSSLELACSMLQALRSFVTSVKQQTRRDLGLRGIALVLAFALWFVVNVLKAA